MRDIYTDQRKGWIRKEGRRMPATDLLITLGLLTLVIIFFAIGGN